MRDKDIPRIERAVKDILELIGEDPNREGLKDTPKRVAKFWKEFIDYDAGKIGTTFEAVKADQMVIVKGIKVWSLCEHHLMPFSSEIAIGYITRKKVLGLSKFARIAHKHAHKLQLQEKLVQDIANEVSDLVRTKDIAVYGIGTHLCMVARGIKTDGQMITSVMNGVFRKESETRNEFLSLVK
jgi:GTP cyclohydrolase I